MNDIELYPACQGKIDAEIAAEIKRQHPELGPEHVASVRLWRSSKKPPKWRIDKITKMTGRPEE